MSQAHDLPAGSWERWHGRALIVAGVLLAVALIGAFLDVEDFLRSYLIAYTFWLGVSLGSLGLWMIHNLTGGAWGNVLRRIFEAATRTLPLLVLLFLPIALGTTHLYDWARGEGDHHGMEQKIELYLNVPFFLVRSAIYLGVWLVIAWLLDHSARQLDRTRNPAFAARMESVSGPGLVLLGLTVTFASIDWIMSLEPHWYSTIFGFVVGTTQLLVALAVSLAILAWLETCRAGNEPVDADTWNDLGNLLLAFVMLWTYMNFSQFLLIWSGNLPEEITWYLARGEGGWQVLAAFVVLSCFALPFLLLLSRDIKRRPVRLGVLALIVALACLLFHYWLIAPAFTPRHVFVHWLDPVLFVGLGALWLAEFVRQLRARPLVFVPPIVEESEVRHA